MIHPFSLPDYRCGACGNQMMVKVIYVASAPSALLWCLSRHCAQHDKAITVLLPIAGEVSVCESATPSETER